MGLTNMEKCEHIVAVSGEGGVPRASYVNNKDDSRNQRFLIHIDPVIGNIHLYSKFKRP